jgi:hypothetical protein
MAAPPAPYVSTPLAAPVAVPVARSSMIPLLVGAGVLVALAVAGAALWMTGVMPGWLNMGPKTAGTAATSTVQPSVTTSTTIATLPAETTPVVPTDSNTSVMSDSESRAAILAEWSTLTGLSKEYGTATTGWLKTTWTANISSGPSWLVDEAKVWEDRFQQASDDFAAQGLSSTYAQYRTDILAIYSLLIERADVYYRTAEDAVANPTVGKSKPWQEVQKGIRGGGRPASVVLGELNSAVTAFEASLGMLP